MRTLLKRFEVFHEFLAAVLHYVFCIREVIGTFVLMIALAGFAFSKAEDIKLGDAIYFAFITALSVGYGDITPQTTIGKIVSVGIGLMGVLFVGITAAVATRALADTARRHMPTKE
jgi:voltage-gated potassium channel